MGTKVLADDVTGGIESFRTTDGFSELPEMFAWFFRMSDAAMRMDANPKYAIEDVTI